MHATKCRNYPLSLPTVNPNVLDSKHPLSALSPHVGFIRRAPGPGCLSDRRPLLLPTPGSAIGAAIWLWSKEGAGLHPALPAVVHRMVFIERNAAVCDGSARAAAVPCQLCCPAAVAAGTAAAAVVSDSAYWRGVVRVPNSWSMYTKNCP